MEGGEVRPSDLCGLARMLKPSFTSRDLGLRHAMAPAHVDLALAHCSRPLGSIQSLNLSAVRVQQAAGRVAACAVYQHRRLAHCAAFHGTTDQEARNCLVVLADVLDRRRTLRRQFPSPKLERKLRRKGSNSARRTSRFSPTLHGSELR